MSDLEELKLYFDYKSPFAYLAMEPALALPERYALRLRRARTTPTFRGGSRALRHRSASA